MRFSSERLFDGDHSIAAVHSFLKITSFAFGIGRTTDMPPNTDLRISIVIPHSADGGSVGQCLQSIQDIWTESIAEIIVLIPRGSELESCKVPDFLAGVTKLTEVSGLSVDAYAQLINEHTEGDFILFLNAGARLTQGFSSELLMMTQNPSCAGVTAKVIDESGSLIEGGGSIMLREAIKGVGEGLPGNVPQYNVQREVESGSRFCFLIGKSDLLSAGGLDRGYLSLESALIDLGSMLRSNGRRVLYQPRAVVQMSSSQSSAKNSVAKCTSPPVKSGPAIQHTCTRNNTISPEGKPHVLVLGIYLARQPNNIIDIVEVVSRSNVYNVTQQWIALCGPAEPKVSEVTCQENISLTPKYVLMNSLLANVEVDSYEYIVTLDDDIVLPEGFIDELLHLQTKLKFNIAQPARTPNSFVDHPIVLQQRGVLARQSRFVEIGPAVSFHRSVFSIVFPFDITSPMGWGYENVWSYKLMQGGMKMGIIDNVPVDHSMRAPVANYNWSEADRQRTAYLGKHAHLSLDECFSVVKVHNFGEIL